MNRDRAWSETRVAIEPDDLPADAADPRDATWWWRGFLVGLVAGVMLGGVVVAVVAWAAEVTSIEHRMRDPLPETTGARG